MDANGPRTGDTGGGFVPSARTGDRRPRAGSAPSRASGSSTVSAPGAAADGGPDGAGTELVGESLPFRVD